MITKFVSGGLQYDNVINYADTTGTTISSTANQRCVLHGLQVSFTGAGTISVGSGQVLLWRLAVTTTNSPIIAPIVIRGLWGEDFQVIYSGITPSHVNAQIIKESK